MSIHSSFQLDKNNELLICLQNHERRQTKKINIGKVHEARSTLSHFLPQLTGFDKKIHLAGQLFQLNAGEIKSLADRTISKLPFSKPAQDLLLRLFNQLFFEIEIVEKEFLSIIDAGQEFDQFHQKVQHLLNKSASPLTPGELQFIFGAEDNLHNTLQKGESVPPLLKQELMGTYQKLLAPLIAKAKRQIATSPRHLAFKAAAEKGRALQAGLKITIALENEVLPLSQVSDKVTLYPTTGSVLKKGHARAREEEHQVDALMSLSMEQGNVPLFSFSDLSSSHFNAWTPNGREGIDLQSTDAKPYVEGMLTFDDLLRDDALYQQVINRLDHPSQIKAVLSAEFQLLDLHKDNLAAVPILAPEHEFYRGLLYAYGLKTSIPFHSLIKDFLSGNIHENTRIHFSTRDRQIKSEGFRLIKEIPALLQALKSPWELVLFDLDRALAESNEIQTQLRHDTVESLIPFRSVLLGTSWKNKPLSKETTDTLQNGLRLQRVRDWVNRKDAPIRKWMKNPEEIDLLTKDVIEQEKYTLSFHRRQGIQTTVEDLRKAFCEELSSLDRHPDIWAAIQKQLTRDDVATGWLKPYTVRDGDTLANIAKSYHLTVEELKGLNPQQDSKWAVKPNMQLRVRDDLTSTSPSAKKLRMMIAGQFFPRLSWKQRNALFERQDRRNEYLQNVELLKKIDVYSPQTVRELERIVRSPSAPVTSNFKKELLSKIQAFQEPQANTKNSAITFLSLVKDLQGVFTPTYLNLAKAMYPLLADTYELLSHLSRGNYQTAGLNIGLYSRPLESLLSEVSHQGTGSIAEQLETRLALLKEGQTAFFGEWSEEDSN